MHEMNLTKRQFMKLAAAATGTTIASSLFPPALKRALATPASNITGTINDVEHIVILMQENRSFDHYLGTLSGVRGFNDPAVDPRRWQQSDGKGGTVEPFHIDTLNTNFPVWEGTPHNWKDSQQALNHGRNDNWVPAKGEATMGYITRQDIPYHFALADAFTTCDAYFASMPGPTCPNRLYMLTGNNDPHGLAGGPITNNNNVTQYDDGSGEGKVYGPKWVTYAEQLQQAGVSWAAYRQGTDKNSDDDSDGGMNMLLAFRNFIDAKPGEPLYDRGVAVRRLEQLKLDVLKGSLPQVSWLFPPRLFCEHPSWPPAYGAEWMARVLDALTANPEVWSKTAFIITYDENDGLFDHVTPPRPAGSREQGLSTVDTKDEINPADGNPFGLGCRVPTFVISPWSKGGYACSETFDHTSLIRFIEKRFGVKCNNISDWRRTVCGDLTSAFNFKTPNAEFPGSVSVTDVLKQLPTDAVDFAAMKKKYGDKPVPVAPAMGSKPKVESGSRPARALPYEFFVRSEVGEDEIALYFVNKGSTGVCFQVTDSTDSLSNPRTYTVEAGKMLNDTWKLGPNGQGYDLVVNAPNGFVRHYSDKAKAIRKLQISTLYGSDSINLKIRNAGKQEIKITIHDNNYNLGAQPYTIPASTEISSQWNIAASSMWYNFSILCEGDSDFHCKLAGHVENGKESKTDPVMG